MKAALFPGPSIISEAVIDKEEFVEAEGVRRGPFHFYLFGSGFSIDDSSFFFFKNSRLTEDDSRSGLCREYRAAGIGLAWAEVMLPRTFY